MSSTVALLVNISRQIIIYMNYPILIAGVIGGVLNLIVFLSLRTFRQSSCAFYLMIMSWVNIGQLLTGGLSRLLGVAYNIDWTLNSMVYCKIRWYCIQFCALTSYSCLCYATIDQYMATSTRVRWQQWSNIKLAYCLCLTSVIFSLLHGIPSILYYNYSISIITNSPVCTITNFTFQQYRAYGYYLVLASVVPVFVTILFGSLAYRNVQQLAYRTVPLVRRELDKQLTSMVLTQVIFSSIALTPYAIVTTISTSLNVKNDAELAARLQLAEYLSIGFYYSYFAVSTKYLPTAVEEQWFTATQETLTCLFYIIGGKFLICILREKLAYNVSVFYVTKSPFYIYVCVSRRFRQQLFYVLHRIGINCCKATLVNNGQVHPENARSAES